MTHTPISRVVAMYLGSHRSKVSADACNSYGHSNGWITPKGEWIKKDLQGNTAHNRIALDIIPTVPELQAEYLRKPPRSGDEVDDLMVRNGYVKVSNALLYRCTPHLVNSRQWDKVMDIIMACRLDETSMVYIENDGSPQPHLNWPALDLTVSRLRGGGVQKGSSRLVSSVVDRHMAKTATNLCSESSFSNGWITPEGEWITKAPHDPENIFDHTHHAIAKHLISTRHGLESLRGQLYDASRVLKEHGGYVRVINAFLFQTTPNKTTSAQWEKIIDIVMSCPSGGSYVTIRSDRDRIHAYWPANDVSVSILRNGKKAPGAPSLSRRADRKKRAANPCNPHSHSNGWITPEGDWEQSIKGRPAEHAEMAKEFVRTRYDLRDMRDRPDLFRYGADEHLMDKGWIKVINSLTFRSNCDRVNGKQWEKVLDVVMSCPLREDSTVSFWDCDRGSLYTQWPAADITLSILKSGRIHRGVDRWASRTALKKIAANPCNPHAYSNGWISPQGEWVRVYNRIHDDHEHLATELIQSHPDLAHLKQKPAFRYGALDDLMEEGWVKVSNAFLYNGHCTKFTSAQWEKILDIMMSCPLRENSVITVHDYHNGRDWSRWPAMDVTTSILKGGRIHKSLG